MRKNVHLLWSASILLLVHSPRLYHQQRYSYFVICPARTVLAYLCLVWFVTTGEISDDELVRELTVRRGLLYECCVYIPNGGYHTRPPGGVHQLLLVYQMYVHQAKVAAHPEELRPETILRSTVLPPRTLITGYT